MLVSVIVPAFNVEDWIDQCLRSILRQTHARFEVLVIDDGSTDGTLEIASGFAAEDKRVKVSSHENRGLSACRNEGVHAAVGDLVVFVDSDDWIAETLFQEVVELYSSSKADVVLFRGAKAFPNRKCFQPGADDFYWRSLAANGVEQVRAKCMPDLYALYPLAPLKVIRRKYFQTKGLAFQEGVKYEDNLHHLRLLNTNPAVSVLPKFLYAWRQNRPGQITEESHTADCLRVLKQMLREKAELPMDVIPYFYISMVRLVAKLTAQNTDRASANGFVENAWQLIAESFCTRQLCSLKRELIRLRLRLHPADLFLSIGFLTSRSDFVQLLSPQVAAIQRIRSFGVLLGRVGGVRDAAAIATHLSINALMLKNFSKGVGGGGVPKF